MNYASLVSDIYAQQSNHYGVAVIQPTSSRLLKLTKRLVKRWIKVISTN